MRSVPIALRVVGAAAGFLILAPVPGTAHAEESAQLTDTVHPVRAEPGSEPQDGRESGAVDRLQIITLTPPSRFEPDDKQGEEENAKRDREGQEKKDEGSQDGKKDDGKKDDGKKDDGSQDGKKDDGTKDDGKKDEGSQDGKKDDGKKDDGKKDDGKKDDRSQDGKKDDGSQDRGDGSGDGSDDESDEGDGPEDLIEDPDPAESPVAPVRAGGGGAADRLAARDAKSADTQGPGTPHTVIGLLLAGAAAVAVAFRSARRRRVGSPDRD
ncbi:hypothetical protein QRN89_12805 [Streptomyces chengbuensis]|uniref:hypothetical protein n=1 Tax=Streptomyces TaxID=1883 RepID=UPI0025B2AB8F|nr:hypothetical protein [Streptomyces sp. HUAS CB01]WJY50616.1 hypothetical protein QRN89_12805 [Streptomyces sp. HUAS CB01]